MSEELRLWENVAVNDAVKHCIQIRENIEQLVKQNNIHIAELPSSLVPTDVLYNMVCCYERLYDLALHLQLVKTGNLRTDTNNIH